MRSHLDSYKRSIRHRNIIRLRFLSDRRHRKPNVIVIARGRRPRTDGLCRIRLETLHVVGPKSGERLVVRTIHVAATRRRRRENVDLRESDVFLLRARFAVARESFLGGLRVRDHDGKDTRVPKTTRPKTPFAVVIVYTDRPDRSVARRLLPHASRPNRNRLARARAPVSRPSCRRQQRPRRSDGRRLRRGVRRRGGHWSSCSSPRPSQPA